MFLRASDLPDVYDVHGSERGPAVGVARIPSLAASRALRAAFLHAGVGTRLPFPCVPEPDGEKWTVVV